MKDTFHQRDGEAARRLIDQGYHIEMINPDAKKFNEKYVAYKDFPADKRYNKRYAILDEQGNVVGNQG